MVSTKVTKTEYEIDEGNGSSRDVVQYRITVPKGTAETLEMGGEQWEWKVKNRDQIELLRVGVDR